VFYVNVPIGVVALLLALRFVPSTGGAGGRTFDLDLIGSLLLGGSVFSLLLPLVEAENGGLAELWWLWLVAAMLLVAFARWEERTTRRGRQPLFDPRLARLSGYAAGLSIGMLYFLGFTGVWLVLARFFQTGLGYSPLHSGLAVTPFALGVAVSAVIAGRLVARLGRRLTVMGLVAIVFGLVAAALVLRYVGGNAAAWAAAGPLLMAGIGGGMVTSPNVTLTLESVPSRWRARPVARCRPPSGSVGRSAPRHWPASSRWCSPTTPATSRWPCRTPFSAPPGPWCSRWC
jgi:hypothetical protein